MRTERMRIGGVFRFQCFGPDGQLKWTEEVHNIVTNAGLDYILDAGMSGGTPITNWYIGLKNAGSVAAGDTMASHSGWTENTNYDEATRQAWSEGGVSSQAITSVGSEAEFTCDTDSQTITGGFLVSDNTKGGTSGTLFAVGDFATSKALDDDDVLRVSYALSAADDGA